MPCDSCRTDKYSTYTICATADIFKSRRYKFVALYVTGLLCQLFTETVRLLQNKSFKLHFQIRLKRVSQAIMHEKKRRHRYKELKRRIIRGRGDRNGNK